MKAIVLVLGLMLMSLAAVGQDEIKHAPTVEQCRVDQRLWLGRLRENVSAQELLPTWDVLNQWQSEMLDCQKIDPTNVYQYINTMEEISAVEVIRLADFLGRHNMYGTFVQEDKEGKR